MPQTLRRYALIEAPSILGLKPTGVEKLPHRLLDAGLPNVCKRVVPRVSRRRLIRPSSAIRRP